MCCCMLTWFSVMFSGAPMKAPCSVCRVYTCMRFLLRMWVCLCSKGGVMLDSCWLPAVKPCTAVKIFSWFTVCSRFCVCSGGYSQQQRLGPSRLREPASRRLDGWVHCRETQAEAGHTRGEKGAEDNNPSPTACILYTHMHRCAYIRTQRE